MAFLGTGLLSGKRSLGAGLGQDLGNSIQGLAQHKIQQKQSSELEKVGFPKELASIFPSLDPKVQQDIWKQINLQNIGQMKSQQPMMQAPQPQQQQESQQSYTPDQVNVLKQLQTPFDRQRAAQEFQRFNQQQATPISSQPSQQFGQAAAQQQAIESAKSNSIFNEPKDHVAEQKDIADYKQNRKEAFELAKYEREKLDKDTKESKEWLKETNKKTKGTRETNARLNRMEKLLESGKLDNPLFASALDSLSHGLWGVGLNLKSLQSPESQEFEKLSNDMLKGIQDVFGSRILKTEVDNFLKTIPTLTQSDAGKKAVIDNLKLLNEATIAQDKVAKDIIKQNGGQIPPDLELMVDNELDSYLDDLHERFVNQTHELPKNGKGSVLLDAYKKVIWE